MTSFITGYIVAICTFPGIVLRLLVTQLLCRYFHVPVFKVSYILPFPPFSKIEIEPPRAPSVTLALIFVPSCANTLIGFLVGAPAVFAFFTGDNSPVFTLTDLFLVWLGVSFAVHSFPTTEQAMTVKRLLVVPQNGLAVRTLGESLMIFMYACALGSILWLDVIYAVAIVVVLPIIVLEILRFSI